MSEDIRSIGETEASIPAEWPSASSHLVPDWEASTLYASAGQLNVSQLSNYLILSNLTTQVIPSSFVFFWMTPLIWTLWSHSRHAAQSDLHIHVLFHSPSDGKRPTLKLHWSPKYPVPSVVPGNTEDLSQILALKPCVIWSLEVSPNFPTPHSCSYHVCKRLRVTQRAHFLGICCSFSLENSFPPCLNWEISAHCLDPILGSSIFCPLKHKTQHMERETMGGVD